MSLPGKPGLVSIMEEEIEQNFKCCRTPEENQPSKEAELQQDKEQRKGQDQL